MDHLPCRLHEGYIFKGNQLCIPKGSQCKQIMLELHGNGIGGSFGRDKTLAKVTDKVYRDVDRLVRSCYVCQLAKVLPKIQVCKLLCQYQKLHGFI